MTALTATPLWSKGMIVALAANLVWINVSEVFRYFVFVMPMMRDALPGVPDAAPMSVPIFLIWGLWDTILLMIVTGASWILLDRFGETTRVVALIGTALWVGIFGIFWLGTYNMNLAPIAVLQVALPLAWIEMVVAVGLVRWARRLDQSKLL